MRKIQRLVAVGAMAVLTIALGACSNAEEPAATPPPTSEPAAPGSEPMTPSTEGMTSISDIAGPACGQVPTEGPGSAAGMVDDPVGTAASNNPLLTSLVTAIGEANLVSTLNGADAITVFAPVNSAFDALPPGTIDQLTAAPDAAQPSGQLYKILATHLVGQRYDAEGLLEAGTVPTLLPGTELIIGGTAPDALTVSAAGVTANVVCANVPTANATVFLIDAVLMPSA